MTMCWTFQRRSDWSPLPSGHRVAQEERGGFYTFGGRWSEQINRGISFLTSYQEGLATYGAWNRASHGPSHHPWNPVGFSMKSTSCGQGYPHDCGSPHMATKTWRLDMTGYDWIPFGEPRPSRHHWMAHFSGWWIIHPVSKKFFL